MEFKPEEVFHSARGLEDDIARTLSELIQIRSPSRGIAVVFCRVLGNGKLDAD